MWHGEVLATAQTKNPRHYAIKIPDIQIYGINKIILIRI